MAIRLTLARYGLLVLTGGVTGAFCDFTGMPAELTSVVVASITVLAWTALFLDFGTLKLKR